MVATIMAVEEEPKEPSFPIWTIMRTSRKYTQGNGHRKKRKGEGYGDYSSKNHSMHKHIAHGHKIISYDYYSADRKDCT